MLIMLATKGMTPFKIVQSYPMNIFLQWLEYGTVNHCYPLGELCFVVWFHKYIISEISLE